MSRLESIWLRYRAMPTTMQWAVGAAVVAVVFLIWNDHIVRLTDEWNGQAERMLADVEKASGDTQRLQTLGRLRPVVLGLGPIEDPGAESAAEKQLNKAINEILKNQQVSDDSYSYRGPSKLRRGTLSRVTGPGEQVERITGDLRFDATPEVAARILADMEASPDIDAISSLRLTRQPGPRRVTVDLTVETWIITAERRTRGGGSQP